MSDGGQRTGVVGTFDGVHLGHRALIEAARAATPLATLVAITFWPHPRSVVSGIPVPMLADREQRRELLHAAGIGEVVELTFDDRMKSTPPKRFVEEQLLEGANLDHVVVGENFRFGARAAGDPELLGEIMRSHGGDATVVSLATRGDAVVSSSRIRECIADGRIEDAATLLGRTYAIRGEVVRGRQRGRELGWPTANLGGLDGVAVPAEGVYAGRAKLVESGADRRLAEAAPALSDGHPAAISVGTNPHFGDGTRTVEAHLLDAEVELYGASLELAFVARLRDQQRFETTELLVEAIRADVGQTRRVLGATAPVR